MSSKRDFLANHPLFRKLEPAALNALTGIAREYEFDEGAVIAYQRDVADKLYIVKRGRLFARGVDERGAARQAHPYVEGQRFKDIWLFLPQTHDATVKATEAGRLVIITQDDFLRFLRRFPDAIDDLAPENDDTGKHIGGLTPDAWEEARKLDAGFVQLRQQPGALVEYSSRRSRWLLVLRVVPLLIFYVLLLAGFFFLRSAVGLFAAPLPTVFVPAFLTFFFALLVAFYWLDWRNDYLIITESHIIHTEFNLSPGKFGRVVQTTPIDQVQSVEVDKPNLFSTLFDVGTVRITTAAQHGFLSFDFLDDPLVVRDTVNMLRQIVRELDAGREQAILRDILEDHFQVEEPYQEVPAEGEEDAYPFDDTLSLPARLRQRYGARFVEGNVITYRKHPFTILRAVAFPAVLLLLDFAALIYALFFLRLDLGIFWLVPVLVGLVAAGWLIWVIEDWRNEIFQITGNYVLDIDRSPFGTGETRKQAALNNVQNVNADRPGLLPTLFNYGNVYIETAGATADITFENVMRPNQVQQDIFDRREQLRRRQQQQESAQRRKELALMFDVYQQAREQDRIPRRTPGPGESGA
jgi:uncharacterized membrane protein YdbT with pleckstrin-like domain